MPCCIYAYTSLQLSVAHVSSRAETPCCQISRVLSCTKHHHGLQVFKEAQDLMPGGVNSPVRAFRSVGGSPIIFERVKVGLAVAPPAGLCRHDQRSCRVQCMGMSAVSRLLHAGLCSHGWCMVS